MALDFLPIVYAFGADDGNPRWRASLRGLAPLRILELASGGVTTEPRDGNEWHYLARLVGGGKGPLVVQYARLDASLGRTESGRHYALDSFAVDLEGGFISSLGPELPEMLLLEEDVMVSIDRGADPHLAFWRLPG